MGLGGSRPLYDIVELVQDTCTKAQNGETILLATLLAKIDKIANDPEKKELISKFLSTPVPTTPGPDLEDQQQKYTEQFKIFLDANAVTFFDNVSFLELACYYSEPTLLKKAIELGFTPLTGQGLTSTEKVNHVNCINLLVCYKPLEIIVGDFVLFNPKNVLPCLKILIDKFPNDINFLCNESPFIPNKNENPIAFALKKLDNPRDFIVELIANGADPFQKRLYTSVELTAEQEESASISASNPWTIAVDRELVDVIAEFISLEGTHRGRFQESLNSRDPHYHNLRPIDIAVGKNPTIKNLLLSAPGIDKTGNFVTNFPLKRIAELLRRADYHENGPFTPPLEVVYNAAPQYTVEELIADVEGYLNQNAETVKRQLADQEANIKYIVGNPKVTEESSGNNEFNACTALEWSCVVAIPEIAQKLLEVGMKPRKEQFALSNVMWNYFMYPQNYTHGPSTFVLDKSTNQGFMTRNHKNVVECIRLICKYCPAEMKKIVNEINYSEINDAPTNNIRNKFYYPPLWSFGTSNWAQASRDLQNDLFCCLIDEGVADLFAQHVQHPSSNFSRDSMLWQIVENNNLRLVKKFIECRSQTDEKRFLEVMNDGGNRRETPYHLAKSKPEFKEIADLLATIPGIVEKRK